MKRKTLMDCIVQISVCLSIKMEAQPVQLRFDWLLEIYDNKPQRKEDLEQVLKYINVEGLLNLEDK